MDENLNVISDVQRDGYIRSKAYPSKWMDLCQHGNELAVTFLISIGCNYYYSERYHITRIVSFCTFV
jgi:hypothetical protein